jgi:hypothetical protein
MKALLKTEKNMYSRCPAVFRCLGVLNSKEWMQDQDSMELLIAGIYHFNLKKIRYGMF